MSVYSTIKGALLGSLLAVPSVVRAEVAADPNCWRAEETESARFEDFRLKLLVGALNCKNYLPGAATSYNQFLAAKKDLVLANMYVVRAHFVHEAGVGEGADQFANYETLAGNKYSTPIFDRAKCETIDNYLKVAATLPDTDLVKMVAVLSPGPLPSGCKIAPRPAAVVAAPVVAVVAAAPPPPLVAVVAAPGIAAPVATVTPVAGTAAPVAVLTPAVLTTEAAPLSDAQRVAASTAATRALIASRASLTRPVVASAPAVVAVPVVAAAPVASQPSLVPAALVVPVAEVKGEPTPAPAAVPPGAAQALADAARALAAAAAAAPSALR